MGELYIGAIRDADRDHDSSDRVRQRPVDNLLGDERLVRDDDFLAVPVGNRCCSNPDPGNGSRQLTDGDSVANANGSLEQNYETGYEVRDNFLQTETQADTERRHQPLDL